MNAWQCRYTGRLRTVADVDEEIDRCQDELRAAERRFGKIAPWESRLEFLKKLRALITTPELALK